MASATSVSVDLSGNAAVDAILYGTKWNTTAVSYGFPASAADVSDYTSGALEATHFTALTTAQQATVESVLAQWSAVSGLTFTRASAAADGDLRIYWYLDGGNLSARVVDFPSDRPEGGDLQLGSALGSGDWSGGSYAYLTLVHEVGHALGLKHPHETLNGFPAADAAADSIEVSVMSYRSHFGGPLSGYSVQSGSYPSGPMLNDIAAIQHLYGPNWTTNAGDTTYSFDPGAGVVLMTIWDGGGNDTYTFASYATDLAISLEPGVWSDFGTQHAVLDPVGNVTAGANLANPYLYAGDLRSLIENARGGTGNDTLRGNVAANHLDGDAGNDSLVGAGGDDTLVGGSGDDALLGGDGNDVLSGGAGSDVLDGGAGIDTADYGAATSGVAGGLAGGTAGDAGGDSLTAVENLIGSAHADTLAGDDGANAITGGGGGDLLSGGGGADTLDGGAGDDTLSGGAGGDLLVGGDGANVVLGGDGADTLSGGSGADTLTGGAGNDLFVYAAGVGVGTIGDFADGDRIAVSGWSLSGAVSEGDGTLVAANAVQVSVAGGVATLHIDTDGVAGAAELNVVLDGTYAVTAFQIVDGGVAIAGAAPPTGGDGGGGGDGAGGGGNGGTQTQTIGGATVQTTVTVVAGTPTLTVSVTPPTAPSPIPVSLGGPAGGGLSAGVPAGVGLTASGPQNPQDPGAASQTLAAAATALVPDAGERAGLLSGLSDFARTLPATAALTVRTVTLTAAGATAPVAPIAVTGSASGMEAVVLDARALPPGTTVTLDDVEFALILGSVQVAGGTGSQHVIGDSAAQVIFLGAADDTLHGGGGDDRVGSAEGDDALYGDAGSDTVEGGLGDDTLYGNLQDDQLYGNQGADTLFGGQGRDTLFGGQDADALHGNLGEDVVYGNRGADALYGNLGADTLFGGQGDDLLFGGQGGDALAGGLGTDTLFGSLGADHFHLGAPGTGADVIADFAIGEDVLVVDGPNFGLVEAGPLGAAHFALDRPGDANDWFVFDTATGVLSFDADGDGAGAAVAIASLNVRTLAASDILVLAATG